MDATQATRSGEGRFSIDARSRGWNVNNRRRRRRRRRSKLAACDHHIPVYYATSEARGQKLMSSPPFMHVMKYMVPSVLVLVTLKYQNKPESLFRENPAPVVCFVAATCVYWLIVGAAKQMTTIDPKCSRIFSHAALATGVLSALSLLSLFLPYPVSLVPLVIWTSLPVVLAWPDMCNLLLRGIEVAVDGIHGVVVWARGVDDAMEEASLPV